jgi:hypothetical protein
MLFPTDHNTLIRSSCRLKPLFYESSTFYSFRPTFCDEAYELQIDQKLVEMRESEGAR